MQEDVPRRLARPGPVLAVVGVAVVILLVIIYGLRGAAPLEGRPAPGFDLAAYDGSNVSLESLRGRIVVVNFWASWCQPCRQEAPALQRVWETNRDKGVVFVGVNDKDVPQAASAFIKQFGITYLNGPDPYDRISRAYRVFGYPETFVIDANGIVRKRFIGAVDEAALQAALDGLLSK